MEEPLCTYERYPKFKRICEVRQDTATKAGTIDREMIRVVAEILNSMDQVH